MSKILITKPCRRWLFGGIGFHNSEATMTALMSETFLNERVLKCFREISPTFSRVFSGYANWTREAMDRFADYYDRTFRSSGTLLYMVPGRMPMPTSDFDMEAYCEQTAANLEYLIKERQCTKIRYFCVTNENSVGNTYAYLGDHPALFAKLHDTLYRAFQRHGLDVGLLATDCSEEKNFHQIRWAMDNIDEITENYCTHLYLQKYQPGDRELYSYCKDLFEGLVLQARTKQKRYILGEFGITKRGKTSEGMPMVNDVSYAVECPQNEGIFAVAVAEMALSIVNSGTFAGAFWTLFDYPDPFIREDGDTPEEKARYDVARFSGHGLQIRYNKYGLVRWCDDEHDYSARASLFTMGYMAKFFKKGSRVLECTWDDDTLRAGAVTNADGSVSVCIISWAEEEKEVSLALEHRIDKPLRRYDFEADRIPQNVFCDLQDYSALVECDWETVVTVKPRSVTFLTTDYVDRVPSPIKNVRIENGTLLWDRCMDAEHCYYRVYASENADVSLIYDNQIASTVAEHCSITDAKLRYKVVSVDKYGNAGR